MHGSSSSTALTGAAFLLLALPTLACSTEPTVAEIGPAVTTSLVHVERDGTPAGGDLQRDAVDYVLGHAAELGLSPALDFAALPEATGEGGVRRTHLQQLHDGLPVLGSELEVHADGGVFLGFRGLVTTKLDGVDLAPTLTGDEASAIALADPIAATLGPQLALADVELVIAPRPELGADLAWQVELVADGPAGRWRYLIDAHTGHVLGASQLGGGCGDGVCSGDETDATCAVDCGCSAADDLCGELVPAPFGCWCDVDCAATGDCCADVSVCELSTAPDGGLGAPCEWGELDAGFFDKARLSFYRAKYFAIAQGSSFLDAPEARRYLLHFLGNSGTELDVDVDKMLDEVPSFAEAVDEQRVEFATAAADDAETAGAAGAVTSRVPDEWGATSTNSDESFNWYYALGSWNFSQTGEVTVAPEGDAWGYAVETRVHVSKNYDWDPNKKVGPLGIFDQAELADLHCYGWAQEFWIKGFSEPSSLEGTAP